MKTIAIPSTSSRQDSSRNLWTAGVAIVLAVTLNACSSGNSAPTNTTTTPAAKTAVQINMGDAPADWMLGFSMNIASMSLTGSNGSVTAVSSTTPMEMMHLMGTMQPLSMISAPQGTYTGATISIASATVMYLDPNTKLPVQKTIAGPISATTTFGSPITVGSTPMAMGFDLDLASSVTADSSGNLMFNPVFHVSSGTQGSGNPLDPANGGIQQMMGAISNITGTSFTMTSLQAAQTFTFSTNSATMFDNITNMSMMANGMLVMVDASLQSDGSLLATRIQSIMKSGGVIGGGVITSATGQPATQLNMVMQNGAGAGMMSSTFGQGVSIALNGSTLYQIDTTDMDMSNLPFTPVFDNTHIYAGQNTLPISSGGMISGTSGGMGMMGGVSMAGSITASEVDLRQQGLSGTTATAIVSGARSSFTMTLPSDSAFTALTGATTVTVYQQPETIISGGSSIASGATVHAFGLLFLNSGQWRMVASRMN